MLHPRTVPGIFLATLLLAGLAMPASAQFGDVIVLVDFVPDGNIPGGGFNELTVTNNGSTDIRVVAIVEDTSEVIYTSVALAGDWSPTRIRPIDWENGEAFGDYGFYVSPKTETLLWIDYFGAHVQLLGWQSATPAALIGPGETLTGFRYLPAGFGGEAHRGGARTDPMPFVAFDEAGEVTATGLTTPADAVPTSATSFGHVKTLFH